MSIRHRDSSSFVRLAVCFAIAMATLAGPFSGLARADNRDRGHGHRGWHQGYYRRPDIYYSAPPVVYPPYGYYSQPGATFSFSFPLR
jgi:hypothetical protein